MLLITSQAIAQEGRPVCDETACTQQQKQTAEQNVLKPELTQAQKIQIGFDRLVAAGKLEDEWTDFFPGQRGYKLYAFKQGKKARSPFSISLAYTTSLNAMTGIGTSTVESTHPALGDYSYKKKNINNNTDAQTLKFGVDLTPSLNVYLLYGFSQTYVDSYMYDHQFETFPHTGEGVGYSESKSENRGLGFTYSKGFSNDMFWSFDFNTIRSDSEVDGNSNDLKYPREDVAYQSDWNDATGENYTINATFMLGKNFSNGLSTYAGLNYRDMNQDLAVIKPDGIHQSAQSNINKYNLVAGAKYLIIGEFSVFAVATLGEGHGDDIADDVYDEYEGGKYSHSFTLGIEQRF